jgi:hypothetical protein
LNFDPNLTEETMSEGDPKADATKLATLRNALDVGVAELDAGLGVEMTPDALMAEVSEELGLETDS